MPARPAIPAYAGLRAPRVVTTFTPLPTRRPRPAAYQRRIIRLFTGDQQRLIPLMHTPLLRAFDDLGRRAAQAYQALFPRPYRQVDPTDAPIVNEIVASMNIQDWESTHLGPVYERHYLRTLSATANSIRIGIGMGVNLPDVIGRKVVAEGGRRLGLLDVQGQSRTALFHALAEGRSQGMAREQLARQIRGRITRGRWRSVQTRAMVIARTETAHAQRISALETYSSMDVVSGMLAFDALGATTDADCEQRNGLVYSRQDADIETSLEHPNGTLNWAPHIDRQALAQRRRVARPAPQQVQPPAPRLPRPPRPATPRPATPTQPTPRPTPPSAPAHQRARFQGVDDLPDMPTGISYDDFQSLEGYVAREGNPALAGYLNTDYRAVNSYFRTGEWPRNLDSVQIARLQSNIEDITKLARTNQSLQGRAVWRGEALVKESVKPLRAGDVVTQHGFTSTSLRHEVASSFAERSRTRQFTRMWEIHNPNKAKAIITPSSHEFEILLAPGQQIRIERVIRKGKLQRAGAHAREFDEYIIATITEAPPQQIARSVVQQQVRRQTVPKTISNREFLSLEGAQVSEALSEYTRTAFGPINNFLRGGKWRVGSDEVKLKGYIANLTKMARQNQSLRGRAVFRGEAIYKKELTPVNVGDVITQPAFTSTSLREKVAEEFTRYMPRTHHKRMWEIHNPHKGNAIITKNVDEAEVLLAPGQQIRVEKIVRGGSKYDERIIATII